LAEYTTPEGLTIVGQLPDGIQGGSFGNNLIAFILSISNNTSTSGVRSSSFISGSFGLGEFIEYIVKQFFNICLWIMRSYNNS
jgi:hypothetical protein